MTNSFTGRQADNRPIHETNRWTTLRHDPASQRNFYSPHNFNYSTYRGQSPSFGNGMQRNN